MSEPIWRRGLLVVLSLVLGSCHSSEREIAVSERFNICGRLPNGASSTATSHGGSDFEVTELRWGSTRATIYVGDFPDFPKFNPDLKFHEGVGNVHYAGTAEQLGLQNHLYRVGLGAQPSVHVLVQIPEADAEFNSVWEQGVSTRIVPCD